MTRLPLLTSRHWEPYAPHLGHGVLRTPHDSLNGTKERARSPMTRDATTQAQASTRRRRTAHERLTHQRAQAQHALEALPQALPDWAGPETWVAEMAGRV